MRWHFTAVLLVLGVTLLVAHGHPIERDEQTSLEESFADAEEVTSEEETNGKKKSNLDSGLIEKEEKQSAKEIVNNDSRIEKLIDDISDSRSAENTERFSQSSVEEFAASASSADKKDQVHLNDNAEETGEKKTSITKPEEEGDKAEKKEDIQPAEEEEEKEEEKKDENEDEDEDVTEEDVTKKDDIKPAASTEGKSSKKDKKGEKPSSKATKKGEDSTKKWWMVEGAHKWGGMGHSHWGAPHQTETQTDHPDEGHFEGPDGGENHSERKGKVGHPAKKSSCCKSKDKAARKRCGCPHAHIDKKEAAHHAVNAHAGGYHFHDKGGAGARSHNNDHDHELRGPWSFGYDGFGDDWGDWDHNHGDFEHLKDLEHESHGGHHEEVNEHEHEADKAAGEDCGAKRDCVAAPVAAPAAAPVAVAAAEDDGIDAPLAPPLGAAVAVAPLSGPALGPAMGPAGMGPAYAVPMPMPFAPPPVARGHALPYRICHACHVLPDGGSRCLCKAIHHRRAHHPRVHHANTHFNHHVYVDCDAAVHAFPAAGHRCRPRHDIPTPEHHTKTKSGGVA